MESRFSHHRLLLVAAFFAFTLNTVLSTGCVAQSSAKQQGSGLKPALGSAAKTEGLGAATQPTINPALSDPSLANEQAPEKFYARFVTSQGDFVVEVNRPWSPNGADRFYNMVRTGYFDDIAIFRAVEGFMFQFGIHGDPEVSKHWSESTIKDDKQVGVSNLPGYLTFAKTGMPNSRSVQMFVNLRNNVGLDSQGFTPFAKVVQGLDVVSKVNTQYGENDDRDNVQGNLVEKGNAWLLKKFPRLDLIKSVEIVEPK